MSTPGKNHQFSGLELLHQGSFCHPKKGSSSAQLQVLIRPVKFPRLENGLLQIRFEWRCHTLRKIEALCFITNYSSMTERWNILTFFLSFCAFFALFAVVLVQILAKTLQNKIWAAILGRRQGQKIGGRQIFSRKCPQWNLLTFFLSFLCPF